MRLLGCGVVVGMARTGGEATETQAAQQRADAALGQIDAETRLDKP
jgi:hypothetical protein